MIRRFLDYLRRGGDEGVFRQIPLGSGGRLYTSPMPFGAYDRGNRVFPIYRKHRIGHVIMLVGDEELAIKARRDPRTYYQTHRLSYSQFPFRDFQAPSLEAIERLVEHARSRLTDTRVAVHCHAGVGRTAVAASCIVMDRDGLDADAAIAHVRRSMMVRMTEEQVQLIRRFGERLGSGFA